MNNWYRWTVAAWLLAGTMIFSSCGKRAVIEQEVKRDTYRGCSFRVETQVWVKGWTGWGYSLEYYEWENHVKFEDVAEVKKAEYEKAIPIYIAVKEALKRGDPCGKP